MNRKPQPRFDPSSTRVRVACAIAAVVATLATFDFIEALAHGYGPVLGRSAPVVVAQR